MQVYIYLFIYIPAFAAAAAAAALAAAALTRRVGGPQGAPLPLLFFFKVLIHQKYIKTFFV